MSSTRTYLVASLFILVFCVENGFSIKCWDCSSQRHPNCDVTFDNKTDYFQIADCDQFGEMDHLPAVSPSICRRIRQKVHGEWRHIRSCGYLDESGINGNEGSCLTRYGPNGLVMEYCTCNNGDGCNSSPIASPKIVFVYVAMFISSGFGFLNRF